MLLNSLAGRSIALEMRDNRHDAPSLPGLPSASTADQGPGRRFLSRLRRAPGAVQRARCGRILAVGAAGAVVAAVRFGRRFAGRGPGRPPDSPPVTVTNEGVREDRR